MSIWDNRIATIKDMLTSGKTLQNVGDLYGVSRERIRQINNKYIKLDRKEFGASKRTKDKNAEKAATLLSSYGRDKWCLYDDLARSIAAKVRMKKQNSKRTKWKFNLDMSEVTFPRYCPVFGVELDYFAEKISSNSPSFDRIDPSKGYVTGNVWIISQRANSIKRGFTYEQLLSKGTEVHKKIALAINQHSSSFPLLE